MGSCINPVGLKWVCKSMRKILLSIWVQYSRAINITIRRHTKYAYNESTSIKKVKALYLLEVLNWSEMVVCFI